jgi:hypothetical protein
MASTVQQRKVTFTPDHYLRDSGPRFLLDTIDFGVRTVNLAAPLDGIPDHLFETATSVIAPANAQPPSQGSRASGAGQKLHAGERPMLQLALRKRHAFQFHPRMRSKRVAAAEGADPQLRRQAATA